MPLESSSLQHACPLQIQAHGPIAHATLRGMVRTTRALPLKIPPATLLLHCAGRAAGHVPYACPCLLSFGKPLPQMTRPPLLHMPPPGSWYWVGRVCPYRQERAAAMPTGACRLRRACSALGGMRPPMLLKYQTWVCPAGTQSPRPRCHCADTPVGWEGALRRPAGYPAAPT